RHHDRQLGIGSSHLGLVKACDSPTRAGRNATATKLMRLVARGAPAPADTRPPPPPARDRGRPVSCGGAAATRCFRSHRRSECQPTGTESAASRARLARRRRLGHFPGALMEPSLRLSVVIPAYNEVRTIETVVAHVRSVPLAI